MAPEKARDTRAGRSGWRSRTPRRGWAREATIALRNDEWWLACAISLTQTQAKDCRHGTTAVEFAMVALPFPLLVFGGMAPGCCGPGRHCSSPATKWRAASRSQPADCTSVLRTTYRQPEHRRAVQSAQRQFRGRRTFNLSFTSPASTLILGPTRTLTTVSCYTLTGQ
jgi:hypothetical protein